MSTGYRQVPLLHPSKTLYVSTLGDDATAARETNKAYANPMTAVTAASVGDTVILLSGTYTLANTDDLWKSGVNLLAWGKVKINKSHSSSMFVFPDAETVGMNIEGDFEFTNTGAVLYGAAVGGSGWRFKFHVTKALSTAANTFVMLNGVTLTDSHLSVKGHLKSTFGEASVIQLATTGSVDMSGIVESTAGNATYWYNTGKGVNNCPNYIFNGTALCRVGGFFGADLVAGVTFNGSIPGVSGGATGGLKISGSDNNVTADISRLTMTAGGGNNIQVSTSTPYEIWCTFTGVDLFGNNVIDVGGCAIRIINHDIGNNSGHTLIKNCFQYASFSSDCLHTSGQLTIESQRFKISEDSSSGWGQFRILAGIVNIKGTYVSSGIGNLYTTSTAAFKLEGGKLVIYDGIKMTPYDLINEPTCRYNNHCVEKTGGTLVLMPGAVLETRNAGALPVKAATAQSIKQLGNTPANGLDPMVSRKLKIKFTVTTAATTTSVTLNDGSGGDETFTEVDTVTYSTKALMAARIMALIVASGTLALDETQDTPGTDEYFYLESATAGVTYTVVAATNLGQTGIQDNHLAITNSITGTAFIIDADVEVN